MASNLQFSTFTWPNNPASYRMKFSRDYEVAPTDNGLWAVTKGSVLARVYECEGVFYGENAYSSFRALATLFISGTSGTLTHPKWDAVQALMTELEVLEEPCENLLRYRAVFVELPE